MPAALTIDRSLLTVDPELVNSYLARVNRFVENVNRFEQQLKGMTNAIKERVMPEPTVTSDIQHDIYHDIDHRQEPAAAKPEQPVITADDIDIDALLNGVDIGGMTM